MLLYMLHDNLISYPYSRNEKYNWKINRPVTWNTRNRIYDDLLYKYLSALYFYQYGLIVESDSISVASDIPSVFNGSCCDRNTSLTR